jgi:hypothetical protein
MSWQKVPFEQINEHSRIPSSINDSAKVKKKSPESILREYDVEKWGTLTNLSQSLTIYDHSYLADRAHEGAGKRLCLLEGDLWLGAASEISKAYVDRSVSILEKIYLENNCDCIVEVGAGYGRILSPLVLSLGPKNIKKVFALDYTDAAIRILTNIFDGSDCDVVTGKIDLSGGAESLALPDWDHSLRPLVFSSQAIMYVPVLSNQFMGLMSYWRSGVFSFVEPSVFNLTASPLRSLQERYIHINDYNTNLADILTDQKERGVIKNLSIEKNILSENAFLPLQRFDWRFS